MNKIYSEPVSKARSLVEGIKKQGESLAKKGIVADAGKLLALCEELEEAGRNQDAAEAQLKVARDIAHAKLNSLKELYAELKNPIKQNFAPETWYSFGIPDKK